MPVPAPWRGGAGARGPWVQGANRTSAANAGTSSSQDPQAGRTWSGKKTSKIHTRTPLGEIGNAIGNNAVPAPRATQFEKKLKPTYKEAQTRQAPAVKPWRGAAGRTAASAASTPTPVATYYTRKKKALQTNDWAVPIPEEGRIYVVGTDWGKHPPRQPQERRTRDPTPTVVTPAPTAVVMPTAPRLAPALDELLVTLSKCEDRGAGPLDWDDGSRHGMAKLWENLQWINHRNPADAWKMRRRNLPQHGNARVRMSSV